MRKSARAIKQIELTRKRRAVKAFFLRHIENKTYRKIGVAIGGVTGGRAKQLAERGCRILIWWLLHLKKVQPLTNQKM